MIFLWFWSSASWKLWSSLAPLQLVGPCSARKEVLSLAPCSPLCPSPPSTGSSPTCSGSSFFVAFTFLSRCPPASASVAVHSTALTTTTAQVARGQGPWERGFALESAVAHVCREAGARVSANVFLRDLSTSPSAQWISAALRSSPRDSPFTGLSWQSTPPWCRHSPDGEPHRHGPDEDGAALTITRRRKERTYPELTGGSGRAKLVVIAVGRQEVFLGGDADLPQTPRGSQESVHSESWLRRWGSILSCAAARAFACSLLGLHGKLGAEDDAPSVSDVLSDFCRAPITD